MKINLAPTEYKLDIRANKRELQELEAVVAEHLELDAHTSGDNPAWDFMVSLQKVLQTELHK